MKTWSECFFFVEGVITGVYLAGAGAHVKQPFLWLGEYVLAGAVWLVVDAVALFALHRAKNKEEGSAL